MRYPLFDNYGNHVANRIDNEAISLDGEKSYTVDPSGNLLDKRTGAIVGHLIPSGKYLPDGKPSPSQNLF